MKIAIDISQIVYSGTGVAQYTKQLVLKLIEIDCENQFILFGSSLRKKKSLENYFKQIKMVNSSVTYKFFSYPPTLLEILWNKLHVFPIENLIGKIDLFHSSDWLEPPSKSIKITTVHDFLVFKYPHLFPKKIIETQKRRIFWVTRESNMIIVDSKNTKKDGIELLSIPEEKIQVIYPGISEHFKKENTSKISRVLSKYSITKPYILSVGTREPRKNLHKIIEAFNLIKTKIDLQLVIVGNFGWGNEKEAQEKNIKYLGYVWDQDLPSLYSGSSCFVYPSLYEGFGFPVLEAMACGTKVITSKGGSLTEVGGRYAEYVNPEDHTEIAQKIIQVTKGKNEKSNNEAITWAKSFTWDKTAKEVINIYNKFR